MAASMAMKMADEMVEWARTQLNADDDEQNSAIWRLKVDKERERLLGVYDEKQLHAKKPVEVKIGG